MPTEHTQGMSVGEIEKRTQARVVALFRERLHYDYLGDCSGKDNRNINAGLLQAWLAQQGVSPALIVVHELAHLVERRHDDRFTALMDACLPRWRQQRELLNRSPLAHEAWGY